MPKICSRYAQDMPKFCPRYCKIFVKSQKHYWLTHWLTESPTWIQEMLAQIKRLEKRHNGAIFRKETIFGCKVKLEGGHCRRLFPNLNLAKPVINFQARQLPQITEEYGNKPFCKKNWLWLSFFYPILQQDHHVPILHNQYIQVTAYSSNISSKRDETRNRYFVFRIIPKGGITQKTTVFP